MQTIAFSLAKGLLWRENSVYDPTQCRTFTPHCGSAGYFAVRGNYTTLQEKELNPELNAEAKQEISISVWLSGF